tara:strand:+ start:83 stop:334 length:252 start_codon:yes stop_codon:yes gene_type:complete
MFRRDGGDHRRQMVLYNLERLRQTLLREQREALVLKGELSDLRQDQRGKSRLVREREAEIKRLKSSIAQLQGEIHGLGDELKR